MEFLPALPPAARRAIEATGHWSEPLPGTLVVPHRSYSLHLEADDGANDRADAGAGAGAGHGAGPAYRVHLHPYPRARQAGLRPVDRVVASSSLAALLEALLGDGGEALAARLAA